MPSRPGAPSGLGMIFGWDSHADLPGGGRPVVTGAALRGVLLSARATRGLWALTSCPPELAVDQYLMDPDCGPKCFWSSEEWMNQDFR